MLKIKYLHERAKSYEDHWEDKKYYKIKNIDLFSELPKHSSFKHGYNDINWTPLFEFIESKIGEDWNDVYSEILKKTKKKFRYKLKRILKYAIYIPIYDEDYIPKNTWGRILYDTIFIDMNNILCKKIEADIISDAKRYKRKIKIQQILERQEKDENNSN